MPPLSSPSTVPPIQHLTHGESLRRFTTRNPGSYNPPPPRDPFLCGLHAGTPIAKTVPADNKLGNGGRPYYACAGGCFLGWDDRTGKEGADLFREQRAVNKRVPEDWLDKRESTKMFEADRAQAYRDDLLDEIKIAKEEAEEREQTMWQDLAVEMKSAREEAEEREQTMWQDLAVEMKSAREEAEERDERLMEEFVGMGWRLRR